MESSDIKYPDDLCALWDYAHGEGQLLHDEDKAAKIWERMQKSLTQELKGSESGEFCSETATDIVQDFLVKTFREARPIHYTTPSIVLQQIRKEAAKNQSRNSYEVNEVLREALHDLVKERCIQSMGLAKRICNSTGFCSLGASAGSVTLVERLEDVSKELPMYGRQKRGSETAGCRPIQPSEAKDLILRVIDMLGDRYCVSTQQLQKLAVDHIRLFPRTTPVPYDPVDEGRERPEDDEPGGEPSTTSVPVDEGPANEPAIDDVGGDYWRSVALRVSSEAAARIWSRIEERSGTNVFCLYTIPKWYEDAGLASGHRHKLKDFATESMGTNRVADLCTWQTRIFHEELKGLPTEEIRKDPSLVWDLQKMVVNRISDQLIGRCTEKGFNPGL